MQHHILWQNKFRSRIKFEYWKEGLASIGVRIKHVGKQIKYIVHYVDKPPFLQGKKRSLMSNQTPASYQDVQRVQERFLLFTQHGERLTSH